MEVRLYRPDDRPALIALWKSVFPDVAPHNSAAPTLDAKLAVDDMLFVAERQGELVGAVMAGYDGHRGWLYKVGVHPARRRRGIGAQLVRSAVAHLQSVGCVKINLQVLPDNRQVVAFYESLGFAVEERISMGRLLKPAQD